MFIRPDRLDKKFTISKCSESQMLGCMSKSPQEQGYSSIYWLKVVNVAKSRKSKKNRFNLEFLIRLTALSLTPTLTLPVALLPLTSHTSLVSTSSMLPAITTLLLLTSMLPVAKPIVKHKSTLCTRGEAKSICVPQVPKLPNLKFQEYLYVYCICICSICICRSM